MNTHTTTSEPDILAIDFDDPLKAQEALLATTRLNKRQSIRVADAAIAIKSEAGKVRIHQTRDVSPSRGAWLGAWWASLLGLLSFGLIGMLAGAAAGGIAGYLYGRLRDEGINDTWMKQISAGLAPGHAAAFFQLPHVYPTHLLRELRRFDGRLLHNSLVQVDSDDVEEALALIP